MSRNATGHPGQDPCRFVSLRIISSDPTLFTLGDSFTQLFINDSKTVNRYIIGLTTVFFFFSDPPLDLKGHRSHITTHSLGIKITVLF